MLKQAISNKIYLVSQTLCEIPQCRCKVRQQAMIIIRNLILFEDGTPADSEPFISWIRSQWSTMRLKLDTSDHGYDGNHAKPMEDLFVTVDYLIYNIDAYTEKPWKQCAIEHRISKATKLSVTANYTGLDKRVRSIFRPGHHPVQISDGILPGKSTHLSSTNVSNLGN